uniref:NB-ARC domain-containing protein n=1 Tax=Leersia perrieri TaxID=77586 RepID=A0A0D9XQA8_9ORYZ
MANKMKAMRAHLEKIRKQHKDFKFDPESSSALPQVLSGYRATSPEVEDADIVGRTEAKQKIVSVLSKKISMHDFTILVIHGMGGIGKTTLAQLVCTDNQFRGYSPVWVHVSEVFDLKKIESSIITQLPGSTPSNIIMVLDDLWEKYGGNLDGLKLKIKSISKGAKVIVIVTTRHEDIASKFLNSDSYKLEGLTDEMCWDIIKQRSGFVNRDDKDQLEQIGREIARKCGGVPLAARSVGYTLHSKRPDEWESVKNSDIWNESNSDDTSSSTHHVLASLKLSYVRMRPCLKMCFGYCAIFPKGQKIVKDDLIQQWICLGLIEPHKVFSPRQLGETYVTELLGMSFLQHSKSSPTTGSHHGSITLYTMHDLVHDLARFVMLDEILVSSKQGNDGERRYRYVLLDDCTSPLESIIDIPTKIKALRFMDCAKARISDYGFSSAKYLRVLDLSECFLQKIPDSIVQLTQLRYLSAPGIQATMIPDCITKLSKLVYLNLRGSSELLSLPESIGEMDCLVHLDLSGCSGLQGVPQSFQNLKLSYLDLSNCTSLKCVSKILGNLTKLQHLNLSYCQYVENLGNLGNLTELQYFHFSSSCSPGVLETDVLGGGTKLEYLNLSTGIKDIGIKRLPEAKGNFTNLKYLNLSSWRELEELPKSWGNLKNLVHLDLSCCFMIKGVPEALRSLIKLQYLNLSFCCTSNKKALKGVDVVLGKLIELRKLYLSGFVDAIILMHKAIGNVGQNFLASLSSLYNLEELDLSANLLIYTLPESIGNLSNLRTLNISDCVKLICLPKAMCEMYSLKHLNVSGCRRLDHSTVPMLDTNSIRLPKFVVQGCNGESSSNIILLQNVYSTNELEISKLEKVVTVEEAERVRLKEKEQIKTLRLHWTRNVKGFVEDLDLLGELEPPRELERFELQGYSSVAFPSWLMNIGPNHFLCLTYIRLVDFPNCTFLPPLGQLPKLESLILDGMNGITRIDEDIYGGAEAFLQLKSFSLCNMASLEEWQTIHSCDVVGGASKFMFPNLKMLEIRHCPNLSLKACPPKVDTWKIESSDNVISSLTGAECASSFTIKEMLVKSCKLPLHRWTLLHYLSPINSLTVKDHSVIESCSDMSSSPEITQALSTLRELFLIRNDVMPELPNWVGKLTGLSRLVISSKNLELNASSGVPRQLISLRYLTLAECESMASLPKWLGDLPSLHKLYIENCPSLNNLDGSLPESIHELTNLASLKVSYCSKLDKWCESEENKIKLSHIPIKIFRKGRTRPPPPPSAVGGEKVGFNPNGATAAPSPNSPRWPGAELAHLRIAAAASSFLLRSGMDACRLQSQEDGFVFAGLGRKLSLLRCCRLLEAASEKFPGAAMATAAIGGMLASAVTKETTRNLGSLIEGEIKLQWNFKRDLQGLKDALESIEAVLEDAERRSIKEKTVQLWLQRLKNASYDISDMLEEFEVETTRHSARKASLDIFHLTNITMAHKMKKMRHTLKNITEQYQSFGFKQGFSSSEQQVLDKRETSSKEGEEFIVGRTEEKQTFIFSCLSDNINNKTTILPIYGIGGIGKTTFAKMVWVYVSQTFDLNKIGNSIISASSKEESKLTTRQMIHTFLGERLDDKKILIVLDDLWVIDDSELNELKSMLKHIGNSCTKVIAIVTTRDKEIADKICTIEPYELPLLTDDMCWTIIEQKVGFEGRPNKDQLEKVGRAIALKCGGVALAAETLGYMLRSMTIHKWESVRDSDIWSEFNSEDRSNQHHKTDPLHHEDVTLLTMHDLVHDLARYVMVDEILDASKQGNTTRCRCRFALLNDCTRPLKSFTHSPAKIRALCFLESDKNVLHGASFSSAKYLRFLVCGKTGFRNDVFSTAKYLHVLDLSECSIQKLPDSIGHLKQLRYLNAPKVQQRIIPNSVTKLLKLIYLSLRGSSVIMTLPESIGEMEALLYLDLSGCSGIQELPVSFSKLKKLIHLDLSNCSHVTGVSESLVSLTKLEYLNLSSQSSHIKRLPEAWSSFINLKYLNLAGFENLEELPTSFGNLKSLMHLDLSNCRQVKGIPEAFGGLTKLQYLNLSYCCNIFQDDFHIRTKAEAIGNLNKLHDLNLSGLMYDYWQQKCISFFECINTLSNLEHLDLSNNKYLHSLPDCFGRLRKLHTLDLSGCGSLKTMPASIGQIDSLKFVHTDACYGLESSTLRVLNKSSITLPHCVVQANVNGSGSNIVLLQDVNPPNLKISRLENVMSVKEVQKIKLMEKRGIKQLEIKWSKNAKRFVGDMELLGQLVPPRTLKNFEIGGYNYTKFPSWFMGIAHYLPNLVCITMNDLPNCISLPPLGQLPNLEELVLKHMNKITKIDENFCGSPKPFPRLKKFVLEFMESLEVWNTRNSSGGDNAREFMFPDLCRLIINRCPKLRITPFVPRADKWLITGSDGVISCLRESVPQTRPSFSTSVSTLFFLKGTILNTLEVNFCNVPPREWRFLHHLPGINNLRIRGCSDLTISPKIIGALSSVQSLVLRSRHNQAELPDWLGQLTSLKKLEIKEFDVKASWEDTKYLTALQSLSLSGCKSMIELPQWVGDLTSLQELTIKFCPNLNNLTGIMGRLTSLRKLEISFCGSIKSLPEGIENLIKLEHISIYECVELKQWCEFVGNKRKIEHVKEMLHTLGISGRWFLNTIPVSLGQIDNLTFVHSNSCPHLKSSKLCLLNKSSILLPLFVVQANEDSSSTNIVLLEDEFEIRGYSCAQSPDCLMDIAPYLLILVSIAFDRFAIHQVAKISQNFNHLIRYN